jgi:hypothetical protein
LGTLVRCGAGSASAGGAELSVPAGASSPPERSATGALAARCERAR